MINRINTEVKDGTIVIPPIVYFEIKKWLLKNCAKVKLAAFENLLAKYDVDTITKEILDAALAVHINLKSKNITIDDCDIFIAGYCKQKNYILITNNTNHYQNIQDLKIENWT